MARPTHCRLSLRESTPSRGFTLIELLVVVVVIGALVMLLLPAVQQAREMARKTQCENNLGQLIIAVNHYEATHGVYPPGTIDATGPVLNARLGYHHNWIVQSLPFLELHNEWAAVDKDQNIYHARNGAIRAHNLRMLLCPSEPAGAPMTSYSACHHDTESSIDAQDNGVFFLNSRLRYRDIKDGTSCTIFLGEKIIDTWDMEWCSGTRGSLRNTGSTINKLTERNGGLTGGVPGSPYDGTVVPPALGFDPLGVPGLESGKPAAEPSSTIQGIKSPQVGTGQPVVASLGSPSFVGGFGSAHHGGAVFALGDGSIRYLNQTIDAAVYQQLGHRTDGKLPPSF